MLFKNFVVMKLHLFVASFLLLCQINKSLSQDFAPVGAKWYYTEKYYMSGDIGYLYAESVKDTIVNGKECRKIINGIINCAFESGINYVYQEDSIAYFFNKKTDSFQILHNFKAKKGDTWETVFYVMDELDTLKATVDSAYTVNINGYELIRQIIKYSRRDENPLDNWYYFAEVTERIGDSYFLFNLYSTSFVCDGNWSEGLRCYEDPEFGFYSTGIAESCTFTYEYVGINNHHSDNEVNIYPNPTPNWIDIECNTKGKSIVFLLDLYGKCLRKFEVYGNARLDMTGYSKGFYILKISDTDKNLITRKVIKN